MSTGIKSEETGISWQMGCWWESRGGRGKRLLLCQLIFDLVKFLGDFKRQDPQCSFVLSTATASLACTYSRTKLVCTKLQLLPVHKPFKNWQANCWNVFKGWVLNYALFTLAVKSLSLASYERKSCHAYFDISLLMVVQYFRTKNKTESINSCAVLSSCGTGQLPEFHSIALPFSVCCSLSDRFQLSWYFKDELEWRAREWHMALQCLGQSCQQIFKQLHCSW